MTNSYDFTADWNRLPAGSNFTTVEQHIVFNDDKTPPDPGITSVPAGKVVTSGAYNGDTGASKHFKIVADPRDPTKMVFQWFFPKGSFGAVGGWPGGAGYGQEEYNVGFLPADVLNVEFDIMFMPGFDFTSPLTTGAPNVGSQGKICPALENGDTRLRVMWNYSNQAMGCHFLVYAKSVATGADVVPSVDVPGTIVSGHWYHIKERFAGGPAGFASVEIDGAEVFRCGPLPNTLASNTFVFGQGSFFGGQALQAARNDSYLLQGPIRVYTGAAVPIPVPVPPPPVPGKMSVTVSVVVKDAAGNVVPATVTVN